MRLTRDEKARRRVVAAAITVLSLVAALLVVALASPVANPQYMVVAVGW